MVSNAETAVTPETKDKVQGIGCSKRRKEDPRFLQGKGRYVDDVQLPGMLYATVVRSPYAHARIRSIDTSIALAMPGVKAVLTAADLKPLNLHWMPTLAGDVQAVLADEKVHFQYQEVAVVVAESRYQAADAAEKVVVDYDVLPALVHPQKAMDEDAPILREDVQDKDNVGQGPRQHPNHIFSWEVGDGAGTQRAFEQAAVTVSQDMYYPRVHPSPLETCGCVADFNKVDGKLTVHITSQAPHVVRTVVSMLSGLPESKVRIISPDIGGGFGNKVGIYPGYVTAIVASLVLGTPVKWIEDRMEHLSTTAWARDYFMHGELAADEDGRITALRVKVLADHGAFNSHAQPTKWPAGFFSICTGSYDIPVAHVAVDGVYTNKAPGGVAYRCSFRVTEAVYVIERLMDVLALKLGMDKAEIRRRNFVRADQFPYHTALGWELDSGDYHTAMEKVLKAVDYEGLKQEQAEKRARGELMGIGLVTFTEVVGAGPSKNCDILGVSMFDSAEIRVHPTGSVTARMGTITQGQGHQTTYAQIIATELGLSSDDIHIEEGDTDTAPYGLGTYGSRSTPVGGAATAVAARKIRDKARKIAAHLMEVSEEDLEWEEDRFRLKGVPGEEKTMKEIAWAAYNDVPEGMEMGLEAVDYYDPPNFTNPFGCYLCVVDIDRFTGETRVRRFYALDDCGTRINPMIIEGQVHGGLNEGFAVAMGQQLPFDEAGNLLGNTFMDYFIPTMVETPFWETDYTVTPSPHHPLGAKGVAESPHVGSIPCFTSAIVDAFSHHGITHLDMPHTAWRIWETLHELKLDRALPEVPAETWQPPQPAESSRSVPLAADSDSQPRSGRSDSAKGTAVTLDKVFPLPVTVEQAWPLLRDIEQVARCMPGAELTGQLQDNSWSGKVVVKLGPATMAFSGNIEVTGCDEEQRQLKMTGKGQDSKGFSSAEMDLTASLVPADDSTGSVLMGHAIVSINGRAASMGGRLMDQVADRVLEQFGNNFIHQVRVMTGQLSADETSAMPATELNGLALGWSLLKSLLARLFGRRG